VYKEPSHARRGGRGEKKLLGILQEVRAANPKFLRGEPAEVGPNAERSMDPSKGTFSSGN